MQGSHEGDAGSLPAYRTVVVGTDGSDTAQEAVRHAVALSRALGATLHLVSAAPGRAGRQLSREAREAPDEIRYAINPREDLEAMLAEVSDQVRKFGVEVVTHAEIDVHPADAILSIAESHNADLIVVGNRGMTGFSRMLGSVPNAISHHASCDVTIVRTS